MPVEMNAILRSALEYEFPPYSTETGQQRVVAFGDHSHKCPVYVRRLPPCTNACPAGEDIRGYHNVLRGLRKSADPMADAWRLLTETNPFPAVMGRLCPAPCESACNRESLDKTVGINAVEHAVGEYAIQNGLSFEKPPASTGKKVAVVGAGPAGLSCAYQLRRRGHSVTIFEAESYLGGMMRLGIAGYRLDRSVLDAEINRIIGMGIEVRTGTRIGKDVTLDQVRKDFDAVFIGIGAQKGRDLPIPGADAPNVLNAVEFLAAFNKGEKTEIGKRVVAIGDGDVAMDVVRLALRLGAEEAVLLSGVGREDMKALPGEYNDAVAEGAKVETCVGTVEVLRENGRAAGLKCVRMEKKAKGEEGWNSPVPFLRYKPVAGTEFEVKADTVVASIGQATDLSGLDPIGQGKPWAQVDGNLQVKGMPGVFAGGDILSLTLLTTAIGQGRKAAEMIDLYVHGKDLPKSAPRVDVIPFKKLATYYFPPKPQFERSHRAVTKAAGDWDEILKAPTEDEAKGESSRCMSCGLCFECDQCKVYCPQEAIIKIKNNPVGEVMFTKYERCVGCHICAAICPTGYIDMGMGEGL